MEQYLAVSKISIRAIIYFLPTYDKTDFRWIVFSARQWKGGSGGRYECFISGTVDSF